MKRLNPIGLIIYCKNRYPALPSKPLVKRVITGYTTNGLVLDFPVIWSKNRIRGTEEDGFDPNEVIYTADPREVGATDQKEVMPWDIIP